MTDTSQAGAAGPVLLFDGACGLCRRVVRWLLRLDGRGRLRFAPLQGAPAQAFLAAHGRPAAEFDSLIFVPDWSRRERPDFLERTAGAIAALRACGGRGRWLAALLAVWPRAWRDAGYRFVARRRRRWFGPDEAGSLDRPEWADRFLG